jgi:diaminohydroxyphosphoribosylaminopyrimidine deaminase/5-amino-6-(5-phosphoribosylamino)uracil reductase
VLVGIGTVLADNPLLTARGRGPRTPARIVVDSRARTPLDCTLLRTLDEGKVIIATAADAPEDKLAQLRDKGADVIVTSSQERVNIKELLSHLGGMQMTNILVEGGGIILGALFEEDLVDAVKVFISPKIIGDADAPGPVAGRGANLMSEVLSLKEISVERIGEDVLIEGLTNHGH